MIEGPATSCHWSRYKPPMVPVVPLDLGSRWNRNPVPASLSLYRTWFKIEIGKSSGTTGTSGSVPVPSTRRGQEGITSGLDHFRTGLLLLVAIISEQYPLIAPASWCHP